MSITADIDEILAKVFSDHEKSEATAQKIIGSLFEFHPRGKNPVIVGTIVGIFIEPYEGILRLYVSVPEIREMRLEQIYFRYKESPHYWSALLAPKKIFSRGMLMHGHLTLI